MRLNMFSYFGGTKTYKRTSTVKTKAEANKKASKLRQRGFNVRITPQYDNKIKSYVIWARKK